MPHKNVKPHFAFEALMATATEMGMSPRDLDAKVVGAEANIDADSITLNHFLDQLIHGAAIARFRVP
jgi:hypothetical protein